MKRRDAKVLAISAGLSVVVVAAIVYSFIIDRRPEGRRRGGSSSWLTMTWGPSLCMVEAKNAGCKPVMSARWDSPSCCTGCGRNRRRSSTAACLCAGADRRSVDLPDGVRNTFAGHDVRRNHDGSARMVRTRHLLGVTPPEYFGVATTLATQVRARFWTRFS